MPLAGSVCDPSRYHHCTIVPMASTNAAQSPRVPGPFTAAITAPPAVPTDDPTVTFGDVEIDALVASNKLPALNSLTRYAPTVAGSVKVTVALDMPLAGGGCEPGGGHPRRGLSVAATNTAPTPRAPGP